MPSRGFFCPVNCFLPRNEFAMTENKWEVESLCVSVSCPWHWTQDWPVCVPCRVGQSIPDLSVQSTSMLLTPLPFPFPFRRHLARNPFICDCNLRWLAEYLHRNPIETSGARCDAPKRMHRRRIEALRDDKFKCKWREREGEGGGGFIPGLLFNDTDLSIESVTGS